MHRNIAISNLRFLAMISVVFTHAFPLLGQPISLLSLLILESMKFGTIAFFVASGYLLEMGTGLNYAKFFKSRLKKVFFPWVFWLSLHTLLFYLWEVRKGVHLSFSELVSFELFSTSFWFVLNFFFAAFVYIQASKRLGDLGLTLLSLLAALVYGVNIHAQWFDSSHTKAAFGYVIFLHLGVLLRRHEAAWALVMNKRIAWVAILAGVSFVLSMVESMSLISRGNQDVLNTLRISNQLFSVAVAVLLLHGSRDIVPSWASERNYTFPIYLLHGFTVTLALKAFQAMWGSVSAADSVVAVLARWFLVFAVGYLLALLATKALRSMGFGLLLGKP